MAITVEIAVAPKRWLHSGWFTYYSFPSIFLISSSFISVTVCVVGYLSYVVYYVYVIVYSLTILWGRRS